MEYRDRKQIGKSKSAVQQTHHYNFEVMKPFVRFGVKAITLIAHVLIGIVKNIPKPERHTEDKNDKRVIKI